MVAVDFRELTVWNEAMLLAEQVYGLSRGFPADERFGMCSQVRRASVSIPSCIAEGNARASTRDYLRFLAMAAGSLAEVQTQLLLAERLQFVAAGSSEAVFRQVGIVARLLQALRNSLEARISEEPTPFPVPRSPFPASP
jgi:four helix bundle protein